MYGFSSDDAEDIVQDAHISAFTELKNFKQRSTYKTWISKIMINKCLYKAKYAHSNKEVSASHLINESEEPVHSTKVESDRIVNNHELLNIIEVCVQRLPLSYRTVFVLREVEGHNVNDTAALLEISPANVKVRLNRAKVLLRKELEKFYTPSELFDIKLAKCDNIVKGVFDTIGIELDVRNI